MKFTTALIEANALYQKFYENDDATLNSIFEMLRPYHSASYDINQEIEQVRYKLKSEHSEFVEKLIEELLVIQKFDVHPSFYNTKWLECYTEPISADLIHPLFIAIKNKFLDKSYNGSILDCDFKKNSFDKLLSKKLIHLLKQN